MASWDEVAAFLKQFKIAVSFGHYLFVQRQKNLLGLAALGVTPVSTEQILDGLTPENYVRGPEKDHDGSQEDVWFFGCDVGGTEVYIKLKLVQDPKKRGVQWAKALGFHPAESPLTYPLKGRGS
jgi:hypothetical protein